MRFNGVDPCTLHKGISIARETLPGMTPRTVETVRGNGPEWLGGVEDERGEYRVEINIAGKNKDEAMKIRALLAKWARSSGHKTARIEPSHWHGKAYDGIVERIPEPTFRFGFGVMEIVFLLPDARAYETAASSSTGTGGSMAMTIGGGEPCAPVITQTMSKDADVLEWQLDGAVFFVADKGGLKAGQIVEVDFANGSMTVDGEHAEAWMDYTRTNWAPGFEPGKHEVTSSDDGMMSARWHNRWA